MRSQEEQELAKHCAVSFRRNGRGRILSEEDIAENEAYARRHRPGNDHPGEG